jgi:hypothetical protein
VREGSGPLQLKPELKTLMPDEYYRCICRVIKPYEILCGLRSPADQTEAQYVREAVESMLAAFIEQMLVIQLKFVEIRRDYKLLSKDSIDRHAACIMLRKGPTYRPSLADMERYRKMCDAKIAPFLSDLHEYTRPSLLQFFEQQLGTLYIFGVPVMSTRVMRTEPGWRQANKFLEIVGSKLRMRLCVLGSSTELLLAEPVMELCTPTVFVVGVERARTAMLAFEVASTQDTAENPVKMFRTESTAYIVHYKWDLPRILERGWDPNTYGPTQKMIVVMARTVFNGDDAAVHAFMRKHCTDSMLEYQMGEELVNRRVFGPVDRGILHALFSKHVPLEDMHSWLVDTVQQANSDSGILKTILKLRSTEPDKAHIRLLMYVTDTWFGKDRLYTVLMIGSVAAAIDENGIDFDRLDAILAAAHNLTVDALGQMAATAQERFRRAQYRVLNQMLSFDAISQILIGQYIRNDGSADETSLRFNSSYWMNVMGYYLRLTNEPGMLDEEIILRVHAFLGDVTALFCQHNPSLQDAAQACHSDLPSRISVCFSVFASVWDAFLKKMYNYNNTNTGTCSESDAKRPKLE